MAARLTYIILDTMVRHLTPTNARSLCTCSWTVLTAMRCLMSRMQTESTKTSGRSWAPRMSSASRAPKLPKPSTAPQSAKMTPPTTTTVMHTYSSSVSDKYLTTFRVSLAFDVVIFSASPPLTSLWRLHHAIPMEAHVAAHSVTTCMQENSSTDHHSGTAVVAIFRASRRTKSRPKLAWSNRSQMVTWTSGGRPWSLARATSSLIISISNMVSKKLTASLNPVRARMIMYRTAKLYPAIASRSIPTRKSTAMVAIRSTISFVAFLTCLRH
mmetsp:Transcript_93519/g.264788  ORF Transcript_93519/g.264788 Transcript_93519/m.264788 type:complete len:270 (-) Transcript_93519:656-1465(-)